MRKTVSVDAAATPRSPSSRSRSRHALRPRAAPATLATLLAVLVLGANAALASAALAGRDASTARTQQCRGGCFEKFATKETLCQQSAECLTCWDECAKPPPSKINKSIRETWSLHTVSMLQQDSLVLVDVAWAPLSSPNQCLVTWEVSGGGLMGNLLTESFNVQLSLWPDTKYRVQVTCKHKLTGSMSRSLPLTIDTAEAITPQERTQQQLQKQAAATTRLPNASSSSSTSDESSAEEESESRQGAAVDRLEPGPGSRLPFDDQSAETLNQHTNFVFNWHTKNSDISSIEPLHKPNALDVLSEATLSELQRPLLFGVVAGSLLLGLVLLLYVCVLRRQRLPGDKAALMADDVHSVVVSFPPSSCSKSSSSSSPSSSSASASSSSSSLSAEEVCRNPETCSRNALKV